MIQVERRQRGDPYNDSSGSGGRTGTSGVGIDISTDDMIRAVTTTSRNQKNT